MAHEGIFDDFASQLESNLSDSFSPFDEIISQTYNGSANLAFFERNDYRNNFLPSLEINFGGAFAPENLYHRQSAGDFHFGPKTSHELMDSLEKHAAFINNGKDRNHITRKELENYLKRAGERLSPEERANLVQVLINFDDIAKADGKDKGKGISYRDLNAYEWQNHRRDAMIQYHRDFRSMHEELAQMKAELAAFKGGDNTNQSRNEGSDNGRVITETRPDKNGHFYVDGADIALSQEKFKRHYGIPQEIDLLKFMPGKTNDGVTDYWQSPVTVGLGGRKPDGELKWNDPNYHTLKYDFSRNFAQVFKYTQGMNEEQQKEFAFNFARTQMAVFKANGFELHKVENEKVYSSGEGVSDWTDFVQDIGGKDPKINW